jgi:hypothetical protein
VISYPHLTAGRGNVSLSRREPGVALCCCVIHLAVAWGCGGGTQETAGTQSHLAIIAKAYSRYLGANQGRLPRDQRQLKEFISSNRESYLKDGSDLDALFTSERDHQPYILLFGPAGEKQAATGVIGYEKLGVGGRRLVAYRFGSVEEVDVTRFQELTSSSK